MAEPTSATLAAARMLRTLARDLEAAELAMLKASAARAALPAGSSRARVTTANARFMETRTREVDWSDDHPLNGRGWALAAEDLFAKGVSHG